MTVANKESVEQALLRELEADEVRWVSALLEKAEALILMRMPDAVNRARVDYPFRVVLTSVEAEAACRVLRAPGGGLYKYETEGTYTYSVNMAVASGLLEITASDWEALSGGTAGYGSQNATMDGYARRRFAGQGEVGRNVEFLLSFKAAETPEPPAACELGLRRWDGWGPIGW